MGLGYSKPHLPTQVPPPVDLSEEVKDIVKDLSELKNEKYQFENLVLEGGGTKGTAYPGALQVLDDMGILKNIKRFAGTSAGACTAGLLSLGYKPGHIASLLNLNQGAIIKDAKWGYLSLVPNLLRHFGWNPGNGYMKMLHLYVREATGDENYTFGQLYNDRGIELCIAVANVTKMELEYCHPKTTPDMPIAEAMRMSASIPGFFQPLHKERNGEKYYYVDGGMLCNYPIHCFDGWFLSMASQDTFFQRLGDSEPPFGKYNEKTIGMVLYSTDELDLIKINVHKRYTDHNTPRPKTTLAEERAPEMDKLLQDMKTKADILEAAQYISRKMKKHDINKDGKICLLEFKKAFAEVKRKHPDYNHLLFGDNLDEESQFDEMDTDADGKVSRIEFMMFLEKKGIFSPLEYIMAISNYRINSFTQFVGALLDTYNIASQRQFVREKDSFRTIGIHTDYVRGLDLDLEKEDKTFLRKKAAIAAATFLKDFIARKYRKNSSISFPEAINTLSTVTFDRTADDLTSSSEDLDTISEKECPCDEEANIL